MKEMDINDLEREKRFITQLMESTTDKATKDQLKEEIKSINDIIKAKKVKGFTQLNS